LLSALSATVPRVHSFILLTTFLAVYGQSTRTNYEECNRKCTIPCWSSCGGKSLDNPHRPPVSLFSLSPITFTIIFFIFPSPFFSPLETATRVWLLWTDPFLSIESQFSQNFWEAQDCKIKELSCPFLFLNLALETINSYLQNCYSVNQLLILHQHHFVSLI
jgi:hypothetical protein